MRFPPLVGLALLAACADTQAGPSDPCGVASSMNQEAVDRATSGVPACERDQDCVVMNAAVECPNVQIGDCGRVVHRLAAEHYAQSDVRDQICDAVEGSKYGCFLSPSCNRTGAPRCESGRCVSAPL